MKTPESRPLIAMVYLALVVAYGGGYLALRVSETARSFTDVTLDVRPPHGLPLCQDYWAEYRGAIAWVPVVGRTRVVIYECDSVWVSRALATVYYPLSAGGL